MIFNIFFDDGHLIRGTIIPDSYSAVPKVRVLSGGQEIAALHTSEINQAVKDLGMHETGAVDFSIDAGTVPGLADIADLELRADDGDLLVYRRFQEGMRKDKFLRIETQLLPLWRLDESVKSSFQMYYRQIEKLGRSGTSQVFLLSQESIYLSGRILFPNFLYSLDKGFRTIVILRDPYEELAERLLILNMSGGESADVLDDRDQMIFRDALSYAADLTLDDEKKLKKFLKRMPIEAATTLANPVVRQFCTTTPDEQPKQGAVARTLDSLSQAAFVGLRSDPQQVVGAYSELFGRNIDSGGIFPRFPKVIELAEKIRKFGYCDNMLELDLELYHHVSEAHRIIEVKQTDAKI